MIEVKALTKSFDGRTVLHGVDATFYSGKTNLIIGQSGSGKTVLMKSLVGLLRPEKGEILFDGRNLLCMKDSEIKELRKEIGMLFQGSALFDSETVLGNVMFPLMMFTRQSRAEMRERAMFCLERVGLKGAESKYPAEISGGMQKRVAIARAIALNPRYLFCDEPNSGLDPKTSMNSVLGIGENIIFINKGHREWVGNMSQIYNTANDDLNDFVFATRLFQQVRRYVAKHGTIENDAK